MEFWGVEVKPGKPLKVQPEIGKLIHISQAALGEVKDVKGAKYVPLRMKIDDKNFIIGSLSAEDRPQVMFDLVFEREFELSHDWKNGSVYVIGYIADDPVSDGEEFSDFDDESEDELVDLKENGNVKLKAEDVNAAKGILAAAGKAKAEAKGEEQESDDDDDEVDSDSDSDDETALDGLPQEGLVISDDDSEDASSDEELPKVQQPKKRPAGSEQKTPASKKPKSATPDKTGKKGKIPTPIAAKAPGNKQSPKSGGQFSNNGKRGGNFSNKAKRGGK